VRIPSNDASNVRDADGGLPMSLAEFPGTSGISEAVFEVGSGSHEFSGPPVGPRVVVEVDHL
jgi:hypothetical protein